MLKHRNLEELYRKTERTIVTAHRGFSGRYPENTLTAMREAIRAGADIIEFDLRPTADGIPVLLHDPTLDRTSNAHGCPEDYTLKELKKFNFSYFRGGHETGKRMEEPEYPEMPIPTFEEVLSELKNEVFMNIQLTRPSDPFMKPHISSRTTMTTHSGCAPSTRRSKPVRATGESRWIRRNWNGRKNSEPESFNRSRRTSRRNSAGKRKNSGSMRICSVPIRTKTTVASFPGDSAAS